MGHAFALARRLPPPAWVVLAAAALHLPRLGAAGLWEPWEVDAAARAGRAIVPTGAGEGLLRAPLALSAAAAALAVYWTGAGLFGRRAGLLASAALLGMPLFVLQARQLT